MADETRPSWQARSASAAAQPASEAAASSSEVPLSQAEQALASISASPTCAELLSVKPFTLQDFTQTTTLSEITSRELVQRGDLDVQIELGRAELHLADALKLRTGSLVPLIEAIDAPVDIYVSGRLIARGEVLVLKDNFCVRVTQLVSDEAAVQAAA